MRKLVLIAHTSLDGFVAGPNGELDWFEPGEENLDFVCQITEEADIALFGRISYQLLDSYWPGARNNPAASKAEISYSNWYNNARKIVISRTIATGDLPNTTNIADNIVDRIREIKQLPGKNILVFGSPSITQILMRNNLIDDYWIFVNPVIFGKGIPLFTELSSKKTLSLEMTKQFPNGELALHYIVKKE